MPETQPQREPTIDPTLLTPPQIARELSRHVIGQDEAVRRMALLMRSHILNVATQRLGGLVPFDPGQRAGPALILGPTGCGKTYLVKKAAEMMRLPFSYEDVTSLSEVGYVGRDLNACLLAMIAQCDGVLHRAERGTVLFLDEIDKTRRNPTVTGPDVSGFGIQKMLLAPMAGAVVQVQLPEGKRGRSVPFNTAGLLVVLAGSFAAGLSDIIRERLSGGVRRMGFGRAPVGLAGQGSEGAVPSRVVEEDLIQFGMAAEFVGRCRDIIVMEELGLDALRAILECPDGPIERAQRQAAREGLELTFTPRILDAIASEAHACGLGARSLHSAVARATRRAMYELPDVVRRRGDADLLLVRLDAPALGDGTCRVVRRRREV